jgi:hypothetical protein
MDDSSEGRSYQDLGTDRSRFSKEEELMRLASTGDKKSSFANKSKSSMNQNSLLAARAMLTQKNQTKKRLDEAKQKKLEENVNPKPVSVTLG